MIQINLIPDVKQELIRAQRARTTVISVAIIAGIIALGLVALLASYVFGAQTLRSSLLDNAIKSESQELASVPDLTNTLTIQNQLTKLDDMHSNKEIDSRLFDILASTNPPAPNNVTISTLEYDPTSELIQIEGQAANNYAAVEVFKKTILNTVVTYRDESDEIVEMPLTDMVSIEETSYGEDASGQKVLRFTISFMYPKEVFANSARNLTINAPNRPENFTD